MNNIKTLKEKLSEIKALVNVSDDFFLKVTKIGTFTGSHFFGVDAKNSDIDIIIPPNDEINWGDTMRSHNGIYLHADEENGIDHYFQNEFQSLYIMYDDKIFNLLFMHKLKFFDKWNHATHKMKKLSDENPEYRERIKDKKERVSLFEEYKEQY